MPPLGVVIPQPRHNKHVYQQYFYLQKWDSDDYRLVRFINSPKQVNNNWAVKLVAELPPSETTDRVVWCDGGSGPEGHPRVYINLVKTSNDISHGMEMF